MQPLAASRIAGVIVRSLRPGDRAAWEPLARAYKAFYETTLCDAEYDAAWLRLMAGGDVHGVCADRDGALLGIAHYVVHASTWGSSVVYLQDLFTDPQARGGGVAGRLIDGVADRARELGAARYYWFTRENNAVARVLYERRARFNGFIRYDYPLG
jgi:GNAT superfamily N-acetyltransferase